MNNKKNFIRSTDRPSNAGKKASGRSIDRNENRPFIKKSRRDDEPYAGSEKSESYKGNIKKKFTHNPDRNESTEKKVFSRPLNRNESRPFVKNLRREDSANIEKDEKGIDKKHSYEKRKSFDKPGNFRKPEYGKKPIVRKAINKVDDGLVRLNKIISSSGICSRREADVLITSGLISVNGKIITELGMKVSPADDIRYNGERMKKERLVYILLNKPKDYITTLKDPFAKRTVLDLIKGACKERVYPVGRLDRNTTGVLLMTNDGDLSKKLSHPSYNRKKIYHVYLDKNLRGADIETISTGIELEDGFIKADEINFVDPKDKKQIGIEIHSGRNRIVRRIFEHLDYKVDKLDRVYFSGLSKKGLQRGEWRFLTEQEVGMLKMGSYE
jgi:23S rRNA pseudouridine2605 synthase